MTTMILLMGEQPAANLLPVRHLKPETVLLVYSERTKAQADRLGKVLTGVSITPLIVDPYLIDRIAAEIRSALSAHQSDASDLLFNLTGGTKPMSLAAYDVAQELGAPFLYFQTEGSRSRIYRYGFDAQRRALLESTDDIAESVTLDEYLRLYLDDYEATQWREPFEQAVGNALEEADYEVMYSVYPKHEPAREIDLVFRDGNQIGIVEVKRQANKKAIDQLVAASGQRYLGTYVKRFVVSAQPLDKNNADLAKAHNVTPIELPDYEPGQVTLSAESKEKLLAAVRGQMRPRG